MPFTVTPRMFATVLGVIALLIGLILLFSPVSANAGGNTVDCGPVARPSAQAAVDDSAIGTTGEEDACSAAHHSRGVPTFILLGVGVVVFAGARFVRWNSSTSAEA